MLKLYYADSATRLNAPAFSDYLGLLPSNIIDKILRFRRWQDAQASLYGKLLLKNGLREFGFNDDLSNLKYNEYGRPYLDGHLDFNISHSGSFVVCCLSATCAVGVDIEEVRPIEFDDFENYFHPDEWAAIHASVDSCSKFYCYWTAKEAVVKAVGKGLSMPLKEIVINKGRSQADGIDWHLTRVDIGAGYITHIASKHQPHEAIMPQQVNFSAVASFI